MKYYYSPSTKGFYVTEIHGSNIPDDAVSVEEKQYKLVIDKQSNTEELSLDEKNNLVLKEKVAGSPDSILSERVWRNFELKKSDIELNKVQDSDPKAKGTVSQWREYRKALRSWPEHQDFPNKDSRPASPDV